MTTQLSIPSLDVVLDDIAAHARQVGDLKSDRIVEAFERQILSGRLAPGARLPTEGELCAILDVSRSVVRDAVRILVAHGLVTVRQGRGTTVAEPNGVAFSNALLVLLSRSGLTMGEVLEARATIDISMVELAAANGTEDDWDRLDAAYGAFEAAVARDDVDAASAAHSELHAGILTAIHQPILTMLLRPMSELTTVVSAASVRPGCPQDWELEAHIPILAALRAGDGEAAKRAMIAHYEVFEATKPEHYLTFLDKRFADAYFTESA